MWQPTEKMLREYRKKQAPRSAEADKKLLKTVTEILGTKKNIDLMVRHAEGNHLPESDTYVSVFNKDELQEIKNATQSPDAHVERMRSQHPSEWLRFWKPLGPIQLSLEDLGEEEKKLLSQEATCFVVKYWMDAVPEVHCEKLGAVEYEKYRRAELYKKMPKKIFGSFLKQLDWSDVEGSLRSVGWSH
ncbi:MAG: hypothetical protein Q9222_002979 [Ikaeria aurantiellina]